MGKMTEQIEDTADADRRDLLRSLGVTIGGLGIQGFAQRGRAANTGEGWLMEKQNPGNTGYAPNSKPPSSPLFGIGPPLQIRWQYQTRDEIHTTPIVSGDTVYVGSDDSRLYAFNATTGEKNWHFDTGGRIHSTPAADGDTVYVGSEDNTVYALQTDGSLRWQTDLGATIHTPILLSDGSLYVGTQSQETLETEFHLLDISDGSHHWQTETTFFNAPPAVSRGLIVLITSPPEIEGDRIIALDDKNGQERWSYETGSNSLAFASPVINPPKVIVPISIPNERTIPGAKLLCLNLYTGEKVWEFQTKFPGKSTPAIAEGRIYFPCSHEFDGDTNTRLFCISIGSGNVIWKYDSSSPMSYPIVARNSVITASGNLIHSINANDGTKRWQTRIGSPGGDDLMPAIKSFSVVDGTIFAGGTGNGVYAFESKSYPWEIGAGVLGAGALFALLRKYQNK